MSRLFLNTYDPLVASSAGRDASQRHGLAPFIDGSIRREPDLEHRFPSITCLCRADRFAPRLDVDDVVLYMTKKRRFGPGRSHRRATAVLRVIVVRPTHVEAAAWYRQHDLALPSNCMVEGNPPKPVSHSHRISEHRQRDDTAWTRKWDQSYRVRARRFQRFVICEPVWRDLGWSAPEVHDADLKAVFGRVPGTLNPGALDITHLEPLLDRLRIAGVPSFR